MKSPTDVVVIGGGIVGLCSALAAADRQLHVTLADDAQPGAASRASAGMLAPSLHGLPASVRALAISARDLYPAFLARLLERSGVNVPLDRGGILELAATEASFERLLSRASPAAQPLGQRELAEFEPALAQHAGAVHHPLDGAVDNVSLMDALWIAADRHPHIEIVRCRVDSVNLAGKRPSVTLSNGVGMTSDTIIMASGAWTTLTGSLRELPVRPVKGELLTLNRLLLRHVVYADAGYLVPRGATTLVGATSDEAGFDPHATDEGRIQLREAAAALVPSLGAAAIVDHWAGLRPLSPDGLPILGRDPEHPALVYACGFSRNGILLGPWAGDVLAALLTDELAQPLPREFDALRF